MEVASQLADNDEKEPQGQYRLCGSNYLRSKAFGKLRPGRSARLVCWAGPSIHRFSWASRASCYRQHVGRHANRLLTPPRSHGRYRCAKASCGPGVLAPASDSRSPEAHGAGRRRCRTESCRDRGPQETFFFPRQRFFGAGNRYNKDVGYLGSVGQAGRRREIHWGTRLLGQIVLRLGAVLRVRCRGFRGQAILTGAFRTASRLCGFEFDQPAQGGFDAADRCPQAFRRAAFRQRKRSDMAARLLRRAAREAGIAPVRRFGRPDRRQWTTAGARRL